MLEAIRIRLTHFCCVWWAAPTTHNKNALQLEGLRKSSRKFLLEKETLLPVFKTVRDHLVFTSKRIIGANVQELSGKKVDYTSIPYSKIQTVSVESSDTLDRDCQLEIYSCCQFA
ncbi:MAG: PH domain-containing protein [Drouetiella hepatica Uher 2000/2452]|jgi:hypothetical protein|uniref:PH domain-containing protein n=1 Tax=Drouetiella hepatica Uher 2000/2452 TaxID=904376 RepID=A0A951QFB5_9CYAN|nr:PH domain-containing protein [Drouetiella hepatica Uher 2000/2452]